MPRSAARFAAAGAAALLCAVAILAATGLLTGSPRGAADNGDGYRLYCGAGLRPATADGRSNWVGGDVIHFTRTTPCPDPMPTSALPILKAAAYGQHDTFDLTRLVWLYVALAGAVTAAAVWASSAVRLHRAVAVLVPLAPLADPDFARFFLSTFSEPAGLLGAYTVLCGAVAAATTSPRCRAPRLVALALIAGGGAVAATAKIGYLPVLAVAVLLCVLTGAHLSRRAARRPWAGAAGAVAALVACIAVAGPVHAAMSWQDRGYPNVNAHNVIFTMLLPEAGPAAAADVGLPPAAAQDAGYGYYGPNGQDLDPNSIPGWQHAVGDHPNTAQHAAWRALLERPGTLLTATGVALQATRGDEVDYLLSAPAPVGAGGPLQIINSPTMGKDTRWTQAWLGGMAAPWWSTALTVFGVLAGVAGLWLRPGITAALTRVAGASSAAAAGMAVVAVVGDGYYEIAKHMWLAGYLLDVTALALAAAAVTAIVTSRRTSRARSPREEPRTPAAVSA